LDAGKDKKEKKTIGNFEIRFQKEKKREALSVNKKKNGRF